MVGWALQIGLGLLGVAILISERLLELFGSDFTAPVFSEAPVILAVGQFANMSLGLSKGILAITGYGYASLRNTLATVSADFLLLILPTPRWGLLGAAFATSIGTIGNLPPVISGLSYGYGPASQGCFLDRAIMAMGYRRSVFLDFYPDLSSARHNAALDFRRT